MKKSQLQKLVSESTVTKDEVNEGRFTVDLETSLSKIVSVEASSKSEAQKIALQLILDEPSNIRGFEIED